jgi:hypothetical protein
LAGEYVKCDLSYVFVFAYELVNNIHDDGLKRLYALWEGCRGDHPELDVYLPSWIMDYILVYHEENLSDLSGLVARFPLKRLPLLQYSEVFFSKLLKDGFSALPLEVLLAVADYDLAECQVPADRLCRAVKGLEASFLKRSTTLMQSCRPSPFTLMRESFRGAVKGRRANRMIKIIYLPYFTQPALRKLLKNALRFGENMLRSELGIPGRYKISSLAPEMRDGITRAMAMERSAERPHLEVDIEIARAIESVSWEMTRQLVVDEPDEPMAAGQAAAPAAGDAGSLSFISGLTVTQRDFLLALLAGKPPEGPCARAFMLPEAVAEQVNEIACGYFGEPVVDTANLEIYSEYVSAISGQFRQEGQTGDFCP